MNQPHLARAIWWAARWENYKHWCSLFYNHHPCYTRQGFVAAVEGGYI